MLHRLVFCSDLARRDPSNQWIERVEGWCISDAAISALGFYRAPDMFENIPHGFVRPDVGTSFPAYSASEKAGFRVSTRQPCGQAASLCLEILGAGHDRQRYVLPVNLETRDIQEFALGESTRLAGTEDERLVSLIAGATDPRLRLRNSLARKPGITLRLDIINKCNLRCIMCTFSQEEVFKRPVRQLSADQFRWMFDQIGPSVREVMLSCGDEPLLSKFLPEILRFLATEHPQVEIGFCTNATLMRAPVRNLILETGVSSLLLSIDAVSRDLFEQIRAGARYDTVIGNILALRDLKNACGTPRPRFVFNFVLMNQNIHEAPAFVAMAKALGAAAIDFRHVVPMTSDFDPNQSLSAHPAKFNYYRDKIAREAVAHGLEFYLPPLFPTEEQWRPEQELPVSLEDFASVQPDPAGNHPPADVRSGAEHIGQGREGCAAEEFLPCFCNRPFSEIMVRDQDEVLPCPWYRRPLGRLSEGKSLADIFFGIEFETLRRNMLRPEGDSGCLGCPVKSGHLPTTN